MLKRFSGNVIKRLLAFSAILLLFSTQMMAWSQTTAQDIEERLSLLLREDNWLSHSLEFNDSILILRWERIGTCTASIGISKSVFVDLSVLDFNQVRIFQSSRLNADMVRIDYRAGYGNVERKLNAELVEMAQASVAYTTEQSTRNLQLRATFVSEMLAVTNTLSYEEMELCDGGISIEPLGSLGADLLVGLNKGEEFVKLLEQISIEQ